MADLIILEFRAGAVAGSQVAILPHIRRQAVTIGGASVQSLAFHAETKIVRLIAEGDCAVEAGLDPTAVATTSVPLDTDEKEYFSVTAGHKLAVITR